MPMSTAPSLPPGPKAQNIIQPWYRTGWVWFLIGIPATSVVLGVVMLWLAVSGADTLVADDYYKEGRAINQRLEKDQKAIDLGVTLKPSITALPNGAQRIQVIFNANPGTVTPEFIRLRLAHPTLDRMDIHATLQAESKGRYVSVVPGIAPGKWYAQLEDDTSSWRVKTEWIVE